MTESQRMKRPWWRAASTVFVVVSLGLLLATQFHFGSGAERLYESTAILQVTLPPEGEAEVGKDTFLRGEMKAMTSDQVFRPVMEELDLAQKWSLSPEQTLVALRGRTVVSLLPEGPDHSRFSLTVRAPEAELTRAIASRIAAEYQEQGNAKARAEFEEKMLKLDAEIAEQRRRVEEKRRLLEDVQKANRLESAKALIL